MGAILVAILSLRWDSDRNCVQERLYVWKEPKLCTGGAPLPPRRSSPCEAVALWMMMAVGAGAFGAALLVSLTCYFWKKNQRFK